MSADQSQTTAKQSAEPVLCKMGCGFFGNGATNGCCSKCWRDMQKSKEAVVAPKPIAPQEEEAQPMEVEQEVAAVPEPTPAVAAPATALKKKKKKKTSYKNMMAGMMKSGERDVEKEKETLRKVTGGGAFSKIDKI